MNIRRTPVEAPGAQTFSSESFSQILISSSPSGKFQLGKKWTSTKCSASLRALDGSHLLLHQPSCLQDGISRLLAVVSAVFLIWVKGNLGHESSYITRRSLIHPDYSMSDDGGRHHIVVQSPPHIHMHKHAEPQDRQRQKQTQLHSNLSAFITQRGELACAFWIEKSDSVWALFTPSVIHGVTSFQLHKTSQVSQSVGCFKTIYQITACKTQVWGFVYEI